MCDTIVAAYPGRPVWIGKNSDREPSEAQVVERHPAAEHPAGARLRVTHQEVAQAAATHEAWISRPQWMWGCEMGVNVHGLAVGNEAVFTRLPVAKTGLTGMDLQRLALERTATAADALELIVELLARHPQGGRMGLRWRDLRYHSSFILADPHEAWVLETAGELWAAERVRGVRTISNVLTIGGDFDRVHDRAYTVARDRGWCRSAADFEFRVFDRKLYRVASGGEIRRAATHAGLSAAGEDLGAAALAAVLRSHGGRSPEAGWRMEMPCAHASYLPTRTSGQTTGSMIARLDPRQSPQVWMTGTSAPCLSVFKPVVFGSDALEGLPPPGDHFDGESLWWRHERLHCRTMCDYEVRQAAFAEERAALEARALAAREHSKDACRALWESHCEAVPGWTERAGAVGRWRPRSNSDLFWGLRTWILSDQGRRVLGFLS